MIGRDRADGLIREYWLLHPKEPRIQRLGQYLVCQLAQEFGFNGVNDPELFYTEDSKFAQELFFEKYVFADHTDVVAWDVLKEGVPKIEIAKVRQLVRSVEYIYRDRLTLCILTATNGAKLVGESNTVHDDRFNSDIGKKFSFGRAFDRLVEMAAWDLRTELTRKGQ